MGVAREGGFDVPPPPEMKENIVIIALTFFDWRGAFDVKPALASALPGRGGV